MGYVWQRGGSGTTESGLEIKLENRINVLLSLGGQSHPYILRTAAA